MRFRKTLVVKPSFAESLFVHNHLFLAQAQLLEHYRSVFGSQSLAMVMSESTATD